MFNPFNPFQAAATSFTDKAKQAAQAADNAGKPAANSFGSIPSMTPDMTSGPFGPAFGQAAQEKLQAGMQDMQQQLQSMFDPQKLFGAFFNMGGGMNSLKDMFPKDLMQALNNYASQFTPSSVGEMGQQFASQAQQAMQAVQQSATQAMQQGAAQTQTPSTNPFSTVDLSGLVTAQQKNMETLSRAQQAATASWQQVMKRQAEIFHYTMQTAAGAMNELMATGAPEDKLARQADLAAQAFEAASQNIEELTQLITQGNQEALRVINTRVQDSFGEIKQAATKLADKTSQTMAQNPVMKTAMDAASQTANAATSAFNRAANQTTSQTTSQTANAAEQATQSADKAASDAVQ